MNFSRTTVAQAVTAAIAITVSLDCAALSISTYNEADANQLTLRISGPNSPLETVFRLNVAQSICTANTLDVYQSADGLKRLHLCTGGVGLPAALAGRRIAVHTTHQVGLGGITPVVRQLGAATPDFWAVPTGGGFLTSCAGITTAPPIGSTSFSTFVLHASCANFPTVDMAADAGISELEPAMFRNVAAPALSGAELSAIPGNPIYAIVYGIPVTLRLRDNLQRILFPTTSSCHPSNAGYPAADETEPCAPSLSKAQVGALFTQNYADWTNIVGDASADNAAFPDPFGFNDLSDAGEVFICRRQPSSATQAAFESQLLAQRCIGGATPFATQASDPVHVTEGNSSSNVISCLTAANAAGRGAIGVSTFEFNPDTSRTVTDSGFRFIKLNHFTPCLLSVVRSDYDFVLEASMQWRVGAINGLPALVVPLTTLASTISERLNLIPAVPAGGPIPPLCAALGSSALVGNAISPLSGGFARPVPPFVPSGDGDGDVVVHKFLLKTRALNGMNSCLPMIDVLPTELSLP